MFQAYPAQFPTTVTHCALDIICETAMGRSLNAQEVELGQGQGSEYVQLLLFCLGQ